MAGYTPTTFPQLDGGVQLYITNQLKQISAALKAQSNQPFTAATTYANLPAASQALRGTIRSITDSNTATLGAIAAGGGTNAVLVWCNGTHWTVIGI